VKKRCIIVASPSLSVIPIDLGTKTVRIYACVISPHFINFVFFFSSAFSTPLRKVLILLLGTFICTGRGYGETCTSNYLDYLRENSLNADPKILSKEEFVDPRNIRVLEIEEPKPGKRVKVYLDDYPGIYYLLFLPYNFSNEDNYGVICEIYHGGLEGFILGYGISGGLDYVLVSLPILNTAGDAMQYFYYPQSPLPAANCWLSILKDLE